jgi:hypothetical protein
MVSTDVKFNNIQEKIFTLQKSIGNKKSNIQFQILAFFVTIVILMIIIGITSINLVESIGIYFKKVNRSNAKDRLLGPRDDNEYPESNFDNSNELNKIEERIMIQHDSQKKNMKPLIDWKETNDIPNHDTIESQIDFTVLEQKYDNYEYKTQNDGLSFWQMLFLPPKYHKLIDNRANPYYKLE